MIGNKFNGDNIVAEFQRILEKRSISKKAQALFESEADDPVEEFLNPPVDEESDSDKNLDPEYFLTQSQLDDSVVSSSLDGNIKAMDAASDGCKQCGSPACDCADYFNTTASHVLNGLGRIAGSLKFKGQSFASDIVEATAISIQEDLVKEASRKIAVSTELTKMAKELSKSGNRMASDMVLITIDRIKKSAAFDDDMSNYKEMEGGWEEESTDLCEICEEDGEEPKDGIGYTKKQHQWACEDHLRRAAEADADYEREERYTRFHEGGGADYGDGSSSYGGEMSDYEAAEGGWE